MDRQFQKDQGFGSIRNSRDPGGDLPVGEVSLASVFSLVLRVLYGRRAAVPEADIPDVAQNAILRLLKWKEKHPEKAGSMTMAEWKSYTAKTAHNEINRSFSNRKRKCEVPIDEASLMSPQTAEGSSNAEMVSLVGNVWQETCKLSLYQRRALLLNSPDLVIYFIEFGVSEAEIVASLDISNEQWLDILERLPLSDVEIAAIARSHKKERDPKAATRAIRKARFDARRKLGRLRK